jgi:hypothetical protein
MTNGQLAANVSNFASDKPKLQTLPVQFALQDYLFAACGAPPTAATTLSAAVRIDHRRRHRPLRGGHVAFAANEFSAAGLETKQLP